MSDTVVWVLTATLLLAPVVQALVVLILYRVMRDGPPIRALTERFTVALAGLLSGLIVAGIAIDRLWGGPTLVPPASTVAILVALLVNGAPPVIFVWLYQTGRFGDGGDS